MFRLLPTLYHYEQIEVSSNWVVPTHGAPTRKGDIAATICKCTP